jgi:hypothetical protein
MGSEDVGRVGQHRGMEDVFIGSEALAAGVHTRGQMRWNHRAIFPDVYIPKDATPSLSQRTIGAWLWSGRRGVVAGVAAAALHGAQWVDESTDVELIWRCGRPPPGIVVRNERIETDEVVEIAGLPATTPQRTALDLARHGSRDSAVPRLDAVARATGLTVSSVLPLMDRYRGARGLCRAYTALSLMDGGSRSPRETLVRLALIDAGFPAPRTDLALIAMGYEAPMVGIEFGTGTPELLVRAGWMVIPAADVNNPQLTVYRVRAAVIERGYPLWRLHRLSRD